MHKPSPRAHALDAHFFRRFFDNDTLSFEGDTQTSVVHAISILAVPGLMVAFWLTPHYPSRSLWAATADHYFFALYSLVAMGCVTAFEWDMLFPDRADFLVLLPLPLKLRELMIAKTKALAKFLGLFLLATNIFGLLLLPAVSGGNYLRNIFSHFIAVSFAGVFASLSMVALEGSIICLFNEAWQRHLAPILQALTVATVLLLLLLFPLCGVFIRPLMSGHLSLARYIPPFWFLGLYEHFARGASAHGNAESLAKIGLWATAIAALLVLITYPPAWRRRKRQAIEGGARTRAMSAAFLSPLLHRALLRKPEERAVFHFIGQTLTRKSRYQVYLAMYCGAGLALASSCVLTFRWTPAPALAPALSDDGLHAIQPLLLFWLIVGLRAAFAFPVDMSARWIFPMNLLHPGAYLRAAKLWVITRCFYLSCGVLCFLRVVGWDARHLIVQGACGLSLALLLTDLLFLYRTGIPFTQPRLPGRTSLPLMLTLYVAVFPPFVLSTMDLERSIETHLVRTAWMLVSALVMHLILNMANKSSAQTAQNTPFDEPEGPLQTLGLIR